MKWRLYTAVYRMQKRLCLLKNIELVEVLKLSGDLLILAPKIFGGRCTIEIHAYVVVLSLTKRSTVCLK